jgi:hypothetical protein
LKASPVSRCFAGRVVRGMDVVKQIQMAPAEGEMLTPMIKILRLRRVSL